jgi:hypothetical protein
MIKNRFLTIIFFLSIAGTCFAGEILLMPEELNELARANNCEQVSDYYLNSPGPVAPLYVYGIASGHPDDSAVFWCRRKTRSGVKYVLMFMLRDKEKGVRHAGEILWMNFPRGLSVYTGDIEALKGLIQLKESQESLPDDRKFVGRGVLSEYDGVEELFVNKNGTWFVRQRH